MKIPMVAPADLGKAAVRHLLEPPRDQDVHYVEVPERYSPQDVAKAFATSLGNSVKAEVIPRDQLIAAYRTLGFSDAAVESYARMTASSFAASRSGQTASGPLPAIGFAKRNPRMYDKLSAKHFNRSNDRKVRETR